MAENLLTVSALRTTVEAELIRGKLEAAGIPAVLVEPEAAADGAPAGRVQVQVNQADFERAMQLLFPIPKIAPAARPAMPPIHPAPPMPPFSPAPSAPFSPAPPAPFSPSPPAPSAPPPRPLPAAPLGGLPPAARFEVPPRLELPPRTTLPAEDGTSTTGPMPGLTVPPLVAQSPATGDASPTASKPSVNGQSSPKDISLPPRRLTRTAEEDGLEIVVPAWDPTTARSGGGRAANRRSPTDADDRAARRAWWTAVLGIPCPPLLVYSMGVVLILGFSNRPLSARGNRFFYAALALNALIVAAAFAICGMLR